MLEIGVRERNYAETLLRRPMYLHRYTVPPIAVFTIYADTPQRRFARLRQYAYTRIAVCTGAFTVPYSQP